MAEKTRYSAMRRQCTCDVESPDMDTTSQNSAVALVMLRRMCRTGEARAVRERAGLSQAEMADATPAARSTVASWETARRVPHGPAALRYFRLLLVLQDETRVSLKAAS